MYQLNQKLPILDRFKRKIRKINESKEEHYLPDLTKFLSLHIETFEQAICTSSIHPYKETMEDCIGMFKSIKKSLRTMKEEIDNNNRYIFNLSYPIVDEETEFNFIVTSDSIEKMITAFDSVIERTRLCSGLISKREEQIYNEVELETIHNPRYKGEEIYLSQGKLMVHATIDDYHGYHTFDFSLSNSNLQSFLSLDKISSYPDESIDTAIRKYLMDDGAETLLVYHNTEKYPFYETLMPIVTQKYEKLLYEQNPDSGIVPTWESITLKKED